MTNIYIVSGKDEDEKKTEEQLKSLVAEQKAIMTTIELLNSITDEKNSAAGFCQEIAKLIEDGEEDGPYIIYFPYHYDTDQWLVVNDIIEFYMYYNDKKFLEEIPMPTTAIKLSDNKPFNENKDQMWYVNFIYRGYNGEGTEDTIIIEKEGIKVVNMDIFNRMKNILRVSDFFCGHHIRCLAAAGISALLKLKTPEEMFDIFQVEFPSPEVQREMRTKLNTDRKKEKKN